MTSSLDDLPSRPEMLMPVTDDHAAKLIEIEVMRSIQRSMEATARQLENLAGEVRDQGKSLHNIDNRLTKIESNSVNTKVAELERKVDTLESERDRRVGAMGLLDWTFKNWPGVLGFIALILIILQTTGKVK